MSSTVFGLGGLDDEARDQSTTARGEITGPACGTGQETKRERAADQLMRTSSSFKGKKSFFFTGEVLHVPAA